MCKKHRKDFTNDELNMIKSLIDLVPKEPTIRIHALMRMYQKRISSSSVYDVLLDYEIIEYNNSCGECRVLLRGNNDCKKRNTVIVVDLISKEIITVYSNHEEDTHKNLTKDRYKINLNIIKELKPYINII